MTESDFERRLREHQRLVFQIAYGVLANAADAEEVTQDVFVRAHREFSTLREPEKFGAWVAQISRRLALNRLRAQTRARRRDTLWSQRAASPVGVEEAALDREFHAQLYARIDRLPEKLRRVLLLCAVDGLDARSVGALLGIPEGTVRSRLHLARKQLLREFSS